MSDLKTDQSFTRFSYDTTCSLQKKKKKIKNSKIKNSKNKEKLIINLKIRKKERKKKSKQSILKIQKNCNKKNGIN